MSWSLSMQTAVGPAQPGWVYLPSCHSDTRTDRSAPSGIDGFEPYIDSTVFGSRSCAMIINGVSQRVMMIAVGWRSMPVRMPNGWRV